MFALRAVQGLFAGYGALALTMAADSAPPERTAYAIGTVQTAQRLGPALGPVIGGVVAQLVGLRNAFLVTSGFYVVALVLVFFLYDERHGRPSRAAAASGRVTLQQRARVRELRPADGGDLRPAVRRPQLRTDPAALRRAARNAGRTGPVDRGHHLLDRGRRRRGRQSALRAAAALAAGADGHRAGGASTGAGGAALFALAPTTAAMFARDAGLRARDRRRRRPRPTPPRAA